MRALRPAVVSGLLALLVCVAPVPAQDEPHGTGAAFGLLDSVSTVVVEGGTALRSRPTPLAERLTTITATTELQVLEQRGDWVRTAYGGWTGWLAPKGEADSEVPRTQDRLSSQMRFDLEGVERAALLASARQLLDAESPGLKSVGGWPLYTDVADERLLALLDRVASQLPRLYAERTGLPVPAVGDDPPPIVIFAREDRYRTFAAENTEISELEGGGHATNSMAALFVDDNSSRGGVAAILLHELTHLLNRAAFVQPPMTWLEEGLANDIGFSRIGPEGDLFGGDLGGTTSSFTHRTSTRRVFVNSIQTGGQATWTQLMRDWRDQRSRLNPLPRLLDMPWILFVDPNVRTSNYALAAFFVRYLLDHAGPETSAAFRDFIAQGARGGATDGSALAQALDTSPEQLQRDYEHWLTAQAVARR